MLDPARRIPNTQTPPTEAKLDAPRGGNTTTYDYKTTGREVFDTYLQAD